MVFKMGQGMFGVFVRPGILFWISCFVHLPCSTLELEAAISTVLSFLHGTCNMSVLECSCFMLFCNQGSTRVGLGFTHA